MSLGDAFPKGLVSASAGRQLKPGVVVKLQVTLDDNRQKEKRLLVIDVNDDVFTCVMNSEIHPLIANNQRRLKCQVAVAEANYQFADRDCHFDCSKVFVFPKDDVIAQLTNSPAWILGRIDEALRIEVLAALKSSPLIPPKQCGEHCAALEAADLD